MNNFRKEIKMWVGYVILRCSKALLINAEHVIHGATFWSFFIEKESKNVLRIVDSRRGSCYWILRKTPNGIEVVKSQDAKKYHADVMIYFKYGFLDIVTGKQIGRAHV